MTASKSNSLTDAELNEAFADPLWAEKFPPILTVDQAAEMLQVHKSTLYQWSSAGRLQGCACRAGKHLRILRNRLIQQLIAEAQNGS